MYFKRLKDLRDDHDLKQKHMEEILNTSEGQYGRYERGDRTIPIDLLQKLAKYYNTSIDYIVGETDNPNRYPEPKNK